MKRCLLASVYLLACLVPAAASDTPAFRPFVRGSWQQIVHAHAGRPTLVNIWSVTCGPCKVELPLLGKFAKDHPDIDVVMITTDIVPNLPKAAKAMLTKAGLQGAESWAFNDSFADRLRFEIDPNWRGDLPRSILLAADGSTTTMEGVADAGDLEVWSKKQRKP